MEDSKLLMERHSLSPSKDSVATLSSEVAGKVAAESLLKCVEGLGFRRKKRPVFCLLSDLLLYFVGYFSLVLVVF